MSSNRNGLIIAITGPSGVGKTTYSKKLADYYSQTARKSIVYTTRKKRANEKDGEQYFFIDKTKFDEMMKNNLFACYTNFCDNMYGIERSYINQVTQVEEKDLIFDTVMKVEELRSLGNNVVIICLMAPTDELIKRIVTRDPGIDLSDLELREENFIEQRKNAEKCDFVVDASSARGEEEILSNLIEVIEEFKARFKITV